MNVRPIRTWIDGPRQYTVYQAEDTFVTWLNNSGSCGSCRTPGLRLLSHSCRHVAEVRRFRLPHALPFSVIEREPEPAMSWAAVAWVCIAIVAIVAAVIRSFS
jgi:hypothetical protein